MTSPDRATTWSPEAEHALAVVTQYYLDQAQHSDLQHQHLPKVLAEIRASFSCHVFVGELSNQAQDGLGRKALPEDLAECGNEPSRSEKAAVALIALSCRRALSQLTAVTNAEEARGSEADDLPDYELLRSGDHIEIQDPASEFYGYRGTFLFYTDPRIGHLARTALVQVADATGSLEKITPHHLRFAPGEEFEANYELVSEWESDDFELRLYDTERTTSFGQKPLLAYELIDRVFDAGPQVIFAGEDFGASPLHAVDSAAIAVALLNFLVLQPGDTDQEYFDEYSALQLRWRDERAADLAEWAWELEEESTRGESDHAASA